jgi:hypothetical protein
MPKFENYIDDVRFLPARVGKNKYYCKMVLIFEARRVKAKSKKGGYWFRKFRLSNV